MKRKLFLLGLLISAVLIFSSCSSEAGMQELEDSAITSDWVDGYWSGTVTTKSNGSSASETIEHRKFTAAQVKGMKTLTGSGNILGVGASIDCKVYANLGRTKMNIIQTYSVTSGGTTTKSEIKYQLTKDK